MVTRLVHRPGRTTTPVRRPDPEQFAAPPTLSAASKGSMPWQTLVPVLGSVASIAVISLMRNNPIMVLIGVVILMVALTSAVAMLVGQRASARRQSAWDRERYLEYLDQQREKRYESISDVAIAASTVSPAPESLTGLAANPARIWERRRSDADFLQIRVGTGALQWSTLTVPDSNSPSQPNDPVMTAEASTLASAVATVPGAPATVALRGSEALSVVGPKDLTRPLVRALIAQAVTWHSPADIRLAALVRRTDSGDYNGLQNLPHTLLPQWDGPVQRRRLAATREELDEVLSPELQHAAKKRTGLDQPAVGTGPTILVLIDEPGSHSAPLSMPAGRTAAELNTTTLHVVEDRLHEPENVSTRVSVFYGDDGDAQIRVEAASGQEFRGVADQLDRGLFTALCHRLAGLRLGQDMQRPELADDDQDYLSLLGVNAPQDLKPCSGQRPHDSDFLTVPIGSSEEGRPVVLDLKESAFGGMGPHGLCVGATGSGKSELLRGLVLGLATRHSAEDLAMILVDYKGGSAFEAMSSLPHVAGIVDNLAEDPQLVERVKRSLEGELDRRQRLLRDTGGYADITSYRRARERHDELPPLPHLLVTIDEFGELLTAEPEFIEVLLRVGRIGRALGVHLLLSSQRLEGGRLRGLDTFLSYRIGLRTFSEQESSMVLETPDAFHLPPDPGHGYLKVDTTVYSRFRSAPVSVPVAGPTIDETDEIPDVIPLTFHHEKGSSLDTAIASEDRTRGPEQLADPESVTLVSAIAERLTRDARSVTPVWLPPLPDQVPILDVVPRNSRRAKHGAQGGADSAPKIPVGLIDDPAKQQQGAWSLDFGQSGGHVAVVGAPQTGRTTFLRAVAAGTATATTPDRVSIYGLDLTGAGLARLEGFPHVGGVATRGNREQQHRLIEEVQRLMNSRETAFQDHGIDSLDQYRRRRSAGELSDEAAPDVLLLVDGFWGTRGEFEDLLEPLEAILGRGASYGIHLVLTLNRWGDLPIKDQSLVGQRIELRLNDPGESSHRRKIAELLPVRSPGRVLTPEGLFAHVALPLASLSDANDPGRSLEELARRSAADWSGPSPQPIRLLPVNLSPNDPTLGVPANDQFGALLGLRQDTMSVEVLQLDGADQHLLVHGDAESGKTTVLRQLLTDLISKNTDDQLVIALMDPRSTLTHDIDPDFLGGTARTPTQARQLAAALVQELASRQDGTAEEGPMIVLAVDDYDVLSASGETPLAPLLDFFPAAADLGFTVLLTRPVAGAARGQYDRAISAMTDSGATGLVLSGDPSEGPLWPGVKATAAVPGRGTIVRRGRTPGTVQIVNQPPALSC